MRSISKRKKSGASIRLQQRSSNCGAKSVLDRIILQENLVRSGDVRPKQSKRFRETGRLCKLREATKLRKFEDERLHLSLTCESAFEAMYLSQMPRICDERGQLSPDYASSRFDLCN